MRMPDQSRLERLARRLALAERAPDEAFVAHFALAMEARALAVAATSERRRQVLLEVAGGSGLLIAAQHVSALGGHAAALLEPVATSLGGLALLGAGAAAMIAALAAGTEQRELA